MEAAKEAWKEHMRKEMQPYMNWGGLPGKSIPFFDKMIERGFFTILSQEGHVETGPKPLDHDLFRLSGCDDDKYRKANGKYSSMQNKVLVTERAFVTGFMPLKQAKRFSYFLNLTDKVAIVDAIGTIPVTYATCFDVDDEEICPKNEPYPGTIIAARSDKAVRSLQRLKRLLEKQINQKLAHVQCFDPRHGRAARKSLYKDVILSLDNTIKSMQMQMP